MAMNSPSLRTVCTLIAAAVLSVASPAAGQDRPKITARASADKVAIDRRVVVTVEATWVERGGKSFRVFTPALPKPAKLKLESVAPKATSSPAADGVQHTVEFVCTLSPEEIGPAHTGPIEVRYLSTDLAQLASGADSSDSAQHSTAKLKPISVQVIAKSLAWLWITLVVTVLGLSAAGTAVIVALVKRAHQDEPARPTAEWDIENDGLNRLAALRARRIEGDAKGYVGQVAELLSDYVRAKFACSATDVAAIAQHLGARDAQRLVDTVTEAEQLQYAKASPTNADLDRLAAFAETLLRANMAAAQPDPKEQIRLKEDANEK